MLGVRGLKNRPNNFDLVEYFCYAVSGMDWAQTAIMFFATVENSWNIQKICAALDYSWLHQKNYPS